MQNVVVDAYDFVTIHRLAMTTQLFALTCVLFIIGTSCSPVAEAASLLDQPNPPAAVYPPSSSFQSWPRRYLYGHLLDDVDYSLPVKRTGNGAWIWMPAQGYVSVSKSQQASGGDVSGKHGRIMRYGK